MPTQTGSDEAQSAQGLGCDSKADGQAPPLSGVDALAAAVGALAHALVQHADALHHMATALEADTAANRADADGADEPATDLSGKRLA